MALHFAKIRKNEKCEVMKRGDWNMLRNTTTSNKDTKARKFDNNERIVNGSEQEDDNDGIFDRHFKCI